MKNTAILTFTGCALIGGAIAMVGCQSGNTDGGTVDHTGQFDPTQSGSMTVALEESDILRVGKIEGFRVFVKDSDGAPVENMPVTCDTEAGLALIEPTSGVEHTDSNGQMSGKVGCELPGSFLLACRAQGVSARRQSVTVRCQGPVPAGFEGFPGAGGGGIGGGSADDVTGSRVRITKVEAIDGGSSATTSIDIQQGTCDNNGTPTAEPFFDTLVDLTVVNDTPFLIKFNTLKYTITQASSSGSSVTSSTLRVTGPAASGVDANGGSTVISSLFLDAASGGKRIFGSSSNISIAGFKNVTFTLTGENEVGDTFSITGSTALSFDNFNRCGT